ncbi:carbonic anhydrase-related protein 10-like [Liolophura sinensis]|uniref:carbonic anhydrase-related protein 10-like n=1 Tax=Liolophura sinensis TaxID=3198878 RepID=UPI0031582F5A
MELLLFDPSLGELEVDESGTPGLLMNNGNEVILKINDTTTESIYVTSGPLSYKYRIQYVKFHFGSEGLDGGEHQIGGLTFPAELQIMAYNCDLYDNFTQAEKSPHGIAGIAVFVQVGTSENEEFDVLAHSMSKVRFQGQFVSLNKVKMKWLLPNTTQFITYEGSLTQPGCYETVTWVIMNRPIYVSQRQIELIKSLNKGGFENSQMLLERNSRPIRPVNHRVIRTNINFRRGCSMSRNISFEVNSRYLD